MRMKASFQIINIDPPIGMNMAASANVITVQRAFTIL